MRSRSVAGEAQAIVLQPTAGGQCADRLIHGGTRVACERRERLLQRASIGDPTRDGVEHLPFPARHAVV